MRSQTKYPSFRSLAYLFSCLALVLAALQARVFIHLIPGPDNISYFEMADQFRQVGYVQALSGHWSPLYSLYLAAVESVLHTGLIGEQARSIISFTALILAGCAVALVFAGSVARMFWPGSRLSPERFGWTAAVLGFSAYLLFVVQKVHLRLPDTLVFCFGTLSLWAWCKVFHGLKGRWALLAGLFGAFGYLSRSSLFPWSLAVLVVAIALLRGITVQKKAALAMLFLTGFFAIAGPQMALLSQAKGYLTFGGGKMPLSEVYEITWEKGPSSWPVRYADGDVRVFEETRMLNFPSFYECEREVEGGTLHFSLKRAVRGVMRSTQSLLFGYWSANFAMLWPLLWLLLPVVMFGIEDPRKHFKRARSKEDLFRFRAGWFLTIAGSLGLLMHLISFCVGYYLPLYLVSLCAGLYGLVPLHSEDERAGLASKAWVLVGAGFILVAVLTTFSFYRDAYQTNIRNEFDRQQRVTEALDALPKPEKGLRKLSAVGDWLGLYAVRMSHSQIYAELSHTDVLADPERFDKAIRVLKDQGVVGLLVPAGIAWHHKGSACRVIDKTPWCLIELT